MHSGVEQEYISLHCNDLASPYLVSVLLLQEVEKPMMNIKRILVAASLTDGRDAAFERGLALARASGAEMYLLHAVPANQAFSVGATHRLERTAELRGRAERAGVVVRTAEQHGDPAEIIELHANARDVDLIVMGADRTPGSRWLRRTSIAERVLRRTTKPALVVPIDDDAESGFDSLLVAVDLTPASKGLVGYAVHLPGTDSPRLTVVHAARGIESAAAVQSPARWTVPEYRTHVLEDARRQLEAVVADVPRAIERRVQVATGSHAEAIVNEAAAVNADLVVVGRSGRFRPLGSTALRVLRDNTRALLVIPVMEDVSGSEMADHYLRAA
jgi:nucleotide-binding universal stress UspA family protein